MEEIMETLISIIVPVYNVEVYLHKCINPIFKLRFLLFRIDPRLHNFLLKIYKK